MIARERRLLVGFLAMLALLAVSIAGYRSLEEWGFIQALYFAVITITTIGFSDYGIGEGTKLFTVSVVAIGLVLWLWLANALLDYAAAHWADRQRRRQERLLQSVRGHYIVVGYGAVGRQVVDWLHRAGRPVVVVDVDESLGDEVRALGLPYLCGDATDEATLARAGLDQAAGLLAVTRDDPVNVFVTLTARGLRPDLYIVANASSPAVVDKLLRAGATTAVSPYALGAHRLAQAALSPHVAELFAEAGSGGPASLMLREAELEAGSTLCGVVLRDSAIRQRTGVMVAAHKARGSGEMVINPSADTVLQAGDVLIAFGRVADLARFVALASPEATAELQCLRDEGRP